MVALSSHGFTALDLKAIRAAAWIEGDPAFPLLDRQGQPLGPKVTMLTPARYNLLSLCVPAFVNGDELPPADILQALWILSPGYRRESKLDYALLRLRWRTHSWSTVWCRAVVAALAHWHRLQFVDRPAREVAPDGEIGDPSDHWLAELVDAAAMRIPWLGEKVIGTPYARIFQILRARQDTEENDKPRFNAKRDRAARRYMEQKRLKAENKK